MDRIYPDYFTVILDLHNIVIRILIRLKCMSEIILLFPRFDMKSPTNRVCPTLLRVAGLAVLLAAAYGAPSRTVDDLSIRDPTQALNKQKFQEQFQNFGSQKVVLNDVTERPNFFHQIERTANIVGSILTSFLSSLGKSTSSEKRKNHKCNIC